MGIKIKATYCLEKEAKKEEVLEEGYDCLAVVYYNDAGEKEVITKVIAEMITATDVEFCRMSDDTTITISADKIIDWI